MSIFHRISYIPSSVCQPCLPCLSHTGFHSLAVEVLSALAVGARPLKPDS